MADRILVVDDEASVRASFEKLLTGVGFDVITAGSAEAALELLERSRPALMIMDIRMPGMDGLEAFGRIKELYPRMPVIIMTGYGTASSAIEATKSGAFDYHLKPVDPPEVLRSVERALQCVRLMARDVTLDPESPKPEADALVGQSSAMQEVYKAIGRVAPTDATVLLRGETGTGKELVARAIYQHSRRNQRPLLVVNCAAIPEPLLESELFGHEKGAYTGAQASRIGKFEQADGGTVFLDEIGDMPLLLQAKVLRVLQDRAFERIGGNETIRADVRVLAATNRNLEAAMAAGKFREDLYHRLDVVTVTIPPLRERREDIPRLVEYFLDRFSRELNVARQPLAKEAMELLLVHPWPGNVRELEHCLHRVMIFTRGYPVQASDIAQALKRGAQDGGTATTTDAAELKSLRRTVRRYLQNRPGEAAHGRFLDLIDRLLVSEALRMTRGNQTQAAKLLGITRPTLQMKARKHGLRRETRFHEE